MQRIPIKALYKAEFSWYIQECWCVGIRLFLVPVCPRIADNLKWSTAHTDLAPLRIILSQTLLHKFGHFFDWHLLQFLPELKPNFVEVK